MKESEIFFLRSIAKKRLNEYLGPTKVLDLWFSSIEEVQIDIPVINEILSEVFHVSSVYNDLSKDTRRSSWKIKRLKWNRPYFHGNFVEKNIYI